MIERDRNLAKALADAWADELFMGLAADSFYNAFQKIRADERARCAMVADEVGFDLGGDHGAFSAGDAIREMKPGSCQLIDPTPKP